MDKILEILRSINGTIDYEMETALIDDKIMDSMDLMSLITELEDTFDISIGMEDIAPENFNSVEAMFELVERLQG